MVPFVYRFGYSFLKSVWFFTRPTIAASNCTVINDGAVLLVRHNYGDRQSWRLPGGGVHSKEDPAATIRRELREEVSLEVEDLTEIGYYEIVDDFRLVRLHCFAAVSKTRTIKPDNREIPEAKWFKVDKLPKPMRWGTEELVVKAVSALSR
jgi:8-oxo-dGTP pyrophosphatase MutT (NUDIX family)